MGHVGEDLRARPFLEFGAIAHMTGFDLQLSSSAVVGGAELWLNQLLKR